jgi:thioredoxin-related protein
MRTVILAAFTLCVFAFSSLYGQSADSSKLEIEKRQKFDPARDAQKNIRNAIKIAIKSNKRILLDVGGEWCIWCRRLDSLFIQNKDLDDFLNEHFIIVKINVSKENENKKVLSHYPEVAGYPHLFVLNKYGRLIHSQNTGDLEYPGDYPVQGHDKKKVFAFLRKWAK